MSCSICMEEYNKENPQFFLPCAHTFHKECVTKWTTDHNSCPMCRTPIRDETLRDFSHVTGRSRNRQRNRQTRHRLTNRELNELSNRLYPEAHLVTHVSHTNSLMLIRIETMEETLAQYEDDEITRVLG
jgi:hypothetical protein